VARAEADVEQARLCATAGGRLAGASLVIGIDSEPRRLEMARRMGADVVLNF